MEPNQEGRQTQQVALSASVGDPDIQFVRERLSANKRWIWICALVGTVGAGLFTLFVPAEYEARASIIMPAGGESSGAAGLASQLGLVAPPSGANVALIGSILDSDRMLNVLVSKYGLEKKKLREKRSVTQNQASNLIEIKFRDNDSKRALELCQSALDSLKSFNKELSLPTKERRAEVLKQSIDTKLEDLKVLEIKFQKFAANSKSVPTALGDSQAGSGFFDAKAKLIELRAELQKVTETEKRSDSAVVAAEQAKGQLPTDIPQMEKMYEDLRKAEQEVIVLKATYTDEYPKVKEAKKRAETLRAQIQKEAMLFAQSYNKGLIKDANELKVAKSVLSDQIRELEAVVEVGPKEATEYERLKREMKYLETVLVDLEVKYEQAQIDEATDPNRWEVLDKPELADKPVNKQFGLSLGLGFIASLFVGFVVALSTKPKG